MSHRFNILLTRHLFLTLISFFIVISCKEDYPDVDVDNFDNKDTVKNTDTLSTGNDFQVYVISKSTFRPVKTFVFINDSLYGSTDQNGMFALKTFPTGSYNFTFSAKDYRDTSLSIAKTDGVPINLSFKLADDFSSGTIYGEFQDMFTFRQKLQESASLASWDEKARYDGNTGATIQYKNYSYNLPDRIVLINNEYAASTDGFGQYRLKIQCGTYKITGTCNGFVSSSRVIKILPDSKNYINFYLERN